jgi:hypothetical protein
MLALVPIDQGDAVAAECKLGAEHVRARRSANAALRVDQRQCRGHV